MKNSNVVVVQLALASGSLYPADVALSPGHNCAPLCPSWYSFLKEPSTLPRQRHREGGGVGGNSNWTCGARWLRLDTHPSADTPSEHLVGVLGWPHKFPTAT